MSETTIRVVTDPEEFESLAPVWNNLLEKGGDESTMYLTHEWLATRWRLMHYRVAQRITTANS